MADLKIFLARPDLRRLENQRTPKVGRLAVFSAQELVRYGTNKANKTILRRQERVPCCFAAAARMDANRKEQYNEFLGRLILHKILRCLSNNNMIQTTLLSHRSFNTSYLMRSMHEEEKEALKKSPAGLSPLLII